MTAHHYPQGEPMIIMLSALTVLAAAVACTGAIITWDWAAERRAQRATGTPDAYAAVRAACDGMLDQFGRLKAGLVPHLADLAAGAVNSEHLAAAREAALTAKADVRRLQAELATARDRAQGSDGQAVTVWLRSMGGCAGLGEARAAWGARCDRLFRIAVDLGEVEALDRTDGPGQIGWRATGGAVTMQLKAITGTAADAVEAVAT